MYQRIIFPIKGRYPNEVEDVTDEVIDISDDVEVANCEEAVLWY